MIISKDPEKVREKLKEIMVKAVDKGFIKSLKDEYPLVIMMIGINGGGKLLQLVNRKYV